MIFQSINPYNSEIIAEHKAFNPQQIETAIQAASVAYKDWSARDLSIRANLVVQLADVLTKNKQNLARVITLEMGKTLAEAEAEVEKCAWVCRYYAEASEQMLAPRLINSDASKSFVRYDALGVILGIMPWNFPFWQVFRFAIPTLMAGNAALLKHASNVFGSAIAIENCFKEAGFPEGVFQSLIVHHNQLEAIVAHSAVKGLSLTGSEKAGSSAASLAGKYLKPSLLELGGSNAFIVLDDADMDLAIETAIKARMQNAGQSCIAAKRFILVGKAHDEFMGGFLEKLRKLRLGNPLLPETQMGPMARPDLAQSLQQQMENSIAKGAHLLLGGNRENALFEPTVLTNVQPGMAAFDEETFGPLAAITKANSLRDAIYLANSSKFGLGLSLFTRDTDAALQAAPLVEDGAFFINEMVKSDPRLPFGGTKLSGFGRELSEEGLLAFVNRKTVVLR